MALACEGTRSAFANDFAAWHADLKTLIDHTDQCYRWGLFDRPPMARWALTPTR